MGVAPPPTARRKELADFLRTRRAAVTPEQVGLRPTGRRGTPSLRHEEVTRLHHLQTIPTTRPDLRLTILAPADETRAALIAALA